MGDTEDDARYPSNACDMNQRCDSSQHPKHAVHNLPCHQIGDNYADDEEEDDGASKENVANQPDGDDASENDTDDGDNDIDNDDDDRSDDDGGDDNEDDEDIQNANGKRIENVSLQRPQKKRKLESLLSSFEFAPRVNAPSKAAILAPKVGRNSLADWSEHETFILLEAWGERYLQHGRKSLRSEDWQEVAKKVSQNSKIERSDSQCRNRLDTLKKKYKKEKAKVEEDIEGQNGEWVYFKTMDFLMSSTDQKPPLSSGVDSEEYIFRDLKVHLHCSNGLDETRDSREASKSLNDDSDLLPPKKTRVDRNGRDSFRLLADSINKFSEIYEKTETSKRMQMVELEKMRIDFYKDIESQKKRILDRARIEFAKIREKRS